MTSNVIKASFISCCLLMGTLSQAVNSDPLINGISIRQELGQESFIGALLATTLTTDGRDILIAQEEKQIQVRILANRISSRRFKRMWIEGMAINAVARELESQSKNMATFSNMLKVTLVKGDIVSIQRSSKDVKVSINGSTLGVIEDTAFFDLLLRTWIGPVPLSSDFREGLLKAGIIDPVLIERFNTTKPTDARITAVAQALVQKAAQTSPPKTTNAKPKVVAQIKPQTNTIKAPVAPTISAPIITAAAPSQIAKIEAPKANTENTETITETEPAPTKIVDTQDKVVESAEVTQIATAAKPEEAAISPATEDGLANIFDEEDQEEFTAESLLAQQLYIAKLKKWTYKKLRYPTRSIEKDEQGMVRLRVTLSRDGNIKNVSVEEAPKYSRLTKSALKAVDKSQPFPSVPADVLGEDFSFTLPIVFKLADR